jgi:ribosomal protein S10
MLINLKISSKNKTSLIRFFKIISKICYAKELKFNFYIQKLQQMKATKIFTVLKSPHANKTSQEQFEYNLFSKKVLFYTFQFLKLVIVLRKLQTELFPDIQIKTYFLIKNCNLKRLTNKIFNLKLYNLKMFQSRNQKKIINKTFLYLKLFDLQGELDRK